MEAYQISRTSWAARFIEEYGDVGLSYLERTGNLNICSYRKLLVMTAVQILIPLLIVGFVLFSIVNVIACWFLGISPYQITQIFAGGGLVFACGVFITHLLYEREMNKIGKEEKKPGLVKTMYRSWKEKYCMPVQLVD